MLKKLTDQIYKYNSLLTEKSLSKDDIKEKENNLEDVLKTQVKLVALLNKLKHQSVGDLEKDNKDLMELHVLLDNLSWYFQNIHERLMDVLKKYPSNSDE